MFLAKRRASLGPFFAANYAQALDLFPELPFPLPAHKGNIPVFHFTASA